MKMRRKTLLGMIEKAAVGLVLLDTVLYLAVVRPLDDRVEGERQRFQSARRAMQADEARLASLEKARTALPVTDREMEDFLEQSVPPRRHGFSHAAGLVRSLTQESGVQLSRVGYRLYSSKKDPLERLAMGVEVEGSFPSLLRFMHGMETTSELVLVRGFSLEPGETAPLSLKLAADLYVDPKVQMKKVKAEKGTTASEPRGRALHEP